MARYKFEVEINTVAMTNLEIHNEVQAVIEQLDGMADVINYEKVSE